MCTVAVHFCNPIIVSIAKLIQTSTPKFLIMHKLASWWYVVASVSPNSSN